jgi:CHAT domain-containing protein
MPPEIPHRRQQSPYMLKFANLMKSFFCMLLLIGRLFLLVCLALSSFASYATERTNKITIKKGQASLILVKSSEPPGSVTFIETTENRRFKFPIQGSTSLAAWYFQPANEPKRYDLVEAERSNVEQTLEIYEPGISQSELLIWGGLLKRISIQLENIGDYDGESKIAKIRLLSTDLSKLPANLKHELQTDLLISRLLLETGLAKEAVVETTTGESCLLELSTFSEYCFEVLQTRANAFERIGDFKKAREAQLRTLAAFSPHGRSIWQRSRLTVIKASAQLNTVHVAVDNSDLAKVQSSLDSLRELLRDEESENILSTYQKGLIYMKLGSALMRSGDFDGAIGPLYSAEKGFKKSSKAAHLSSVYSLLHSCHYVQGRYLQALDMITLAIEHAGDDSPFYHYYLLVQGNALAKLGRYHQAKASLTTAKIFYESSQNTYYLSACYKALAVVERELGNFEGATRLHDVAIKFFWDEEGQSPSNLYSYLMTKSESVITSLRGGDISKSRENAAELERSYAKYFESNNSAKSLPEKSVVYALARYASLSGNMTNLVKYRDKLSQLLNEAPVNSYLLEKAQLEQLNVIEDLKQDDFIAAASHFKTLMSHINKTRDQVRVISFQRGYSNIVKGFAEPLIEKLSLSLSDDWDSDTADILLEVLDQIQGATVVEASRSARVRIANGAHYNTDEQSSKSLNKEIEVFTAQNQTEKYALRAKADHSVLRENVVEAKARNSTPEKFVHQIASIGILIESLSKGEIYLNSFDAKAHSFILYLSKSRSGIISIEKSKNTDRLIETAKQLLVDRYSEPEPILDQISKAFSLEDMLGSGEYQHAITTGDGKLSEIPFSTLRVNDDYLGTQISNTHIASTSYYFSSKEAFDAEQALSNDIAVIADPSFDIGNLISLNRGSQDENYQNWISSLSRLPWTAKESQSIEAAFPDAKVAVRTREQATINTLKSLASTSKILHIATHGYFSSKTPELAGIALTKTLDSTSGFLSLNQISKLDIASRLVVFSACETARSEESEGDSGWGLAQVVLYAGARNAVGTLWKVPDRQTALFFESFYNSLSDGRNNISTSLLISKRAMINSQYSHPFYWAGFKAFATKQIDTHPFEF